MKGGCDIHRASRMGKLVRDSLLNLKRKLVVLWREISEIYRAKESCTGRGHLRRRGEKDGHLGSRGG